MEKEKHVFDFQAYAEDFIKNGPRFIEEYEYDENGKLKSRTYKINPEYKKRRDVKKEQTQVRKDITLEDIYKAFSIKKKHYVTRLKHAFGENHVESVDDLMKLSINELLNMDGIGSETLRLLIKNLNSLGIDYYPVKSDGRATD